MKGQHACAVLALSLLTAFTCTGCAGAQEAEDTLHIVCTGFAEYDWTRQILGTHAGEADITYLLANGSDLHSYQPSAVDMAKISRCDLIVYTGGESGQWVTDALAGSPKDGRQVCDLYREDGLPEEDEAHECSDPEAHHHGEADEHVWLSLTLAQDYCAEITEALCTLDAENAADYRANLADYTAQLQALDDEFRSVTEQASVRTLVFGDRFPFRYLLHDYGLDYYAAFEGCSAETEASFDTIIFLAGQLDALGATTIYTIEGSDQSVAATVIASTKNKDQQIAVLNSLQSVTAKQIADGADYLSLMQQNCDVLKETMH